MDYKKLPEKLLRQSYFMAYNEILNFLHIIKILHFSIFNFLPEKLLRQSYFMAYNEILNFLHIIKIFHFLIFNFFGGESENKK